MESPVTLIMSGKFSRATFTSPQCCANHGGQMLNSAPESSMTHKREVDEEVGE